MWSNSQKRKSGRPGESVYTWTSWQSRYNDRAARYPIDTCNTISYEDINDYILLREFVGRQPYHTRAPGVNIYIHGSPLQTEGTGDSTCRLHFNIDGVLLQATFITSIRFKNVSFSSNTYLMLLATIERLIQHIKAIDPCRFDCIMSCLTTGRENCVQERPCTYLVWTFLYMYVWVTPWTIAYWIRTRATIEGVTFG